MPDQYIRLALSIKALRTLIRLALILNIVFILTTYWVYDVYPNQLEIHQVLSHDIVAILIDELNLGAENNLATWYSSMLFLLTGLVAILCYWINNTKKNTPTIFNKGWLLMGALFFILSLDEMGSFHESIGNVMSLGYKSWQSILLIPAVMGLLFMIIFSWQCLRHHPTTIILFTIGAIFIATVPLQEYFEMKMMNEHQVNGVWRRPAWLASLEEGTELFGVLSFLTALVFYVNDKLKDTPSGFELRFSKTMTRAVSVVIGVLVLLASIMVYFFRNLTLVSQGDEGIASNWFPSAVALLTFIVCLLYGLKILNSMYFLMLSIYFGTNYYALIYWDNIQYLTAIVGLFILTGLFVFNYQWHHETTSKPIKLYAWSALIITISALGQLFAAPLMVAAITLLLVWFIISRKAGLHISIYDRESIR